VYVYTSPMIQRFITCVLEHVQIMLYRCNTFRHKVYPRVRSRRTSNAVRSNEEKMSIQEYIEEHALGKKVEDVINAAVKAKAPEPISFMVSADLSGSQGFARNPATSNLYMNIPTGRIP